ncbi:hypothetical protein [Solibacillus sp. FSL H8-0538]|uniref:hypothetical protein n=1 Tax=Solibacillus sp. FSL H8-0538 TaxID=2921400 RepID=UPI0030F6C8DB
MKNLIHMIITAAILVFIYYVTHGQLDLNVLLFIAIIMLILIVSSVLATKMHPQHAEKLGLIISFSIIVLFGPCFAVYGALGDLAEPLTSEVFMRCILMFSIAPIIWLAAVILSYRHYFIQH